MDIFSHGLYGGIAFGRKSRRSYWIAVFFGMLPDLASFGILFFSLISTFLWTGSFPEHMQRSGPPDLESIPSYVFALYDLTHSLLVFALLFGSLWLLLKRPFLEMLAWPIHILLDIFTHSNEFFPTPFLWPISEYRFDGWSWGTPWIFIPNLIFLVILYGSWWYRRKRKGNTALQ